MLIKGLEFLDDQVNNHDSVTGCHGAILCTSRPLSAREHASTRYYSSPFELPRASGSYLRQNSVIDFYSVTRGTEKLCDDAVEC